MHQELSLSDMSVLLQKLGNQFAQLSIGATGNIMKFSYSYAIWFLNNNHIIIIGVAFIEVVLTNIMKHLYTRTDITMYNLENQFLEGFYNINNGL